MATIEKLVKAFEALKVFNTGATAEDLTMKKKEAPLTKKDKIIHCQTIADAIIAPSLRVVPDFHKFLGIVIETFLMCCDDEDSDVRMVADECLTRIIRALTDSNLGRLQVELYKEIKKNGNCRSLRAALWRFAELVYIVNLLPCIIALAQRPEEQLQETLAFSIGKIFPVLGQFTNDTETKSLLKSFIPNLKSSSASTRRTSALCLTIICQNSRKPDVFAAWLFSALIDYLVPIQSNIRPHTILGMLLAIRHLLPILTAFIDSRESEHDNSKSKQDGVNYNSIIDQYLQVYEVLLRYTQHDDHNVVTASLETLSQLFLTPPEDFIPFLVNHGLITHSRIYNDDMSQNIRGRTMSQLSVAGPPVPIGDEEALADDPELLISSKTKDLVDHIPSPFSDDCAESGSGDSVEDISEYSSIPVGKFKVDPLPALIIPTSYNHDQESKQVKASNTQLDVEYQDVPLAELSPVQSTRFQVGDIGSFIDEDVPLLYCTRLLCSSFLLTGYPGSVIPDQNIRVSVKSLALNCLAGVFNLYPKAFYYTLFKSTTSEGETQWIQDIVLFSTHSDPRLRGSMATLLGTFLKSALSKSGCQFDIWLKDLQIEIDHKADLESHISIILALIVDESSIASRIGLQALRICLPLLLQSVHAILALQLLKSLIDIHNNPYWLVKVELIEILSTINFKTVAFLETHVSNQKPGHCSQNFAGGTIQWRVINKVIIHLLGDEDHRVRFASSQALLRMIPNMFYPSDANLQDPIIASAKEKSATLLDPIIQDGSSFIPPTHAVIPPFNSFIEGNLTRIIDLLSKKLMTSTSRHLTFGCIEALKHLSEEYVVTHYINAWSILFSDEHANRSQLKNQTGISNMKSESFQEKEKAEASIVSYLMALTTNSALSLDLTAHQNMLQLTGNLLSGACYQCLLQKSSSVSNEKYVDKTWLVVQNKHIATSLEQMRSHLMRLLNIYVHVVDEIQPGPPHIKPTLPSLPTTPSLSPVKRRVKSKEESNLPSPLAAVAKNSPSKQLSLDSKLPSEKEKNSSNKSGLGTFYHVNHYMKLFEVIRGAYSTYKISLDVQSTEKLIGLLKSCLTNLCQILEIAGIDEMGKCADELLSYLKSVLIIDSSSTIQCVQQLLKSLFGTNLASWFDSSNFPVTAGDQISSGTVGRKPGHATRLNSSNGHTSCGLYHNCFTTPYTHLTQSLNSAIKSTVPALETAEESQGNGWMSWLRKKSDKKLSGVIKSSTKQSEKNSLASYIRLFEPLVIKVLNLLAQLVQLRVNYCLLDSEQIFLGFVIKQFEYIEEGQIPCASQLISHIFNFLVLLSYERYHSKSIIGVPKIIQLCDGIMASGQSSIDYAIPALFPVVEDLFKMRTISKSDPTKELETQREVVISMLFRLINYHQVLEMLITVLRQSRKESEDRWKKLSRQIIDLLLPLLVKQQVVINSLNALNTLHRLFGEVSASVFRPVDILLKALFSPPQSLSVGTNLEHWLCLVLAVFRVLISQSKEEVVLSRLIELGISVKSWSIMGDNSPITEYNCILSPEEIPMPEETIARFLFYVIGVIATEIKKIEYYNKNGDKKTFLCQQAAHIMLYITHMFQSGMFRRVATAAMSIVRPENSEMTEYQLSVQKINRLFLDLAIFHPTLTLQWCNILILLNYDDHCFWTEVLRAKTRRSTSNPKHIMEWISTSANSCNIEMVRKGGLILFCDYVCENPNDAEQMTWLIANHVNELINLSTEPPVHDFICAIHRNSAASGLLIQAVNARCEDLSNPGFVRRTLLNLEAVHASQTGSLLTLLVDKFLNTHQLSLARMCDTMVCHRIEMLLAELPEEAAAQIPVEDIDKLFESMKASNIIQRHARLVSLLVKLRSVVAPGVPLPELDIFDEEKLSLKISKKQHSLDSPSSPTESSLTKDWYIGIVKKECCGSNAVTKVCAKLLSCLDYRDVIGIMVLKDFNLKILQDCFLLGLHYTLNVSNKDKSSPSSESSISSPIVPNRLSYSSSNEFPLYSAAKMTLLQHITHFASLLPRPHLVFFGKVDSLSPKENKYKSRLFDLFSDQGFVDTLFQIMPVLTCYLNTLRHLPWVSEVPADSFSDISRFCVLCIEVMHWNISRVEMISYQRICLAFSTITTILKNSTISAVIGLAEHMTWTSSLIAGTYEITKALSFELFEMIYLVLKDENLPEIKTYFPEATSQEAFDPFGRLDFVVLTPLGPLKFDPRLARLPMVNSYARMPPIVWEMNWMPEFSGDLQTKVPPPSGELLQEQDDKNHPLNKCLEQQRSRRGNGWTSRQQFEETWMALLGVLSATPLGSSSSEEDEERIQTSCLAVKCITSLLLQTMMLPQPGNPHNSLHLQQHRNKPLGFLHTRQGSEVLNDGASSSASSSPTPVAAGSQEFHQREQSLAAYGLDIHSCLHFLLDLYSQWMSPQIPQHATDIPINKTPLSLLTEVTRSVVLLSDIFTERAQFDWMQDILLDLTRTHPPEDEIISQYLIVGICKSVAVLNMESDMVERLRKLVELSLRSTYLPVRIATLHGILYILQLGVGEEISGFIPIAIDYIVKHLDNSNLPSSQSEEHVLIMWSVIFYILENNKDDISDPEIVQKIFQLAVQIVNSHDDSVQYPVYLSIVQGLERLLLTDSLTSKDLDVLLKLSKERLQERNPNKAFPAAGLLVSCMYSEKHAPPVVSDSADVNEEITSDHETIITAMERATVLFDRFVRQQELNSLEASGKKGEKTKIRKGFPYEAEIISTILPTFLTDFFPSQEILNKVIGEFLSSQQPHPQLMASVVFKVFESLHLQSQQLLIQDWVMLSLSNFTQRSPVSMAIWSLTCFFVSASTNAWLRSLYPFLFHYRMQGDSEILQFLVQQRMGLLENFDSELFCRAALDFRDQKGRDPVNLMEESQRTAFRSTIQVVAEPNTPYINLLSYMSKFEDNEDNDLSHQFIEKIPRKLWMLIVLLLIPNAALWEFVAVLTSFRVLLTYVEKILVDDSHICRNV
ncbi:Huntingtin [Nymphon striatum]|nr:Huntingtin [Nymphon striatum]